MRIVLDNNSLFSIMNPKSVSAYLFASVRAKFIAPGFIKSELEKLDLIKLKEEHIIKIIDIFPQDASDLNKIFTDVSLNEDETNKILEIVKNSK